MKFTNEEKAVREIKCYGYCLRQACTYFENNNYLEASFYLENAARSLRELDKLKAGEGDEAVVIVGIIGHGGNVPNW